MMAAIQHDIGGLALETSRLRLRRFRPEDADAVFAVIGDEVAMQYYPRKFTWDDAMAWVERNMRRYREDGHGLYAVTRKDSDELIGDTGIVRQVINGETLLEVGYHFRRDQWGHGYATEAARACMDYAFRELGAERVISLIRSENIPSRRVAERNGMTIEREVMHANLLHLVYAMRRCDHGEA
jgi:RimJ/RimL family protein N-acetyltransferase